MARQANVSENQQRQYAKPRQIHDEQPRLVLDDGAQHPEGRALTPATGHFQGRDYRLTDLDGDLVKN